MPRYILRYVSFAKTSAHQGLPGHAILGQGLLHNVHGTGIRPGRCGLEACLRQIERVPYTFVTQPVSYPKEQKQAHQRAPRTRLRTRQRRKI
jgi:hypothetical protein